MSIPEPFDLSWPSSDGHLLVGPAALADIARGLAHTADVWADRLPKEARIRTGMRLTETLDYDAWLLRWPAGTGVTPHDHGESAGAFAVVSGELCELRWHAGLRRSRLLLPGEVVTVGRGVVHDVVAPGPGEAVSVHVYAPPLAAMGFYDEAGRLVDRQAVERSNEAFVSARELHPSGKR